MIRDIRKGTEFVYVEYMNGGSSTLHARGFTVETDENQVVLSFDLSHNQRIKNRSANAFLDVSELLEKASNVKLFELEKEKWPNPLAYAIKEYPDAPRLLDARFKDGVRKVFPYSIKATEFRIIFEVEPRD